MENWGEDYSVEVASLNEAGNLPALVSSLHQALCIWITPTLPYVCQTVIVFLGLKILVRLNTRVQA